FEGRSLGLTLPRHRRRAALRFAVKYSVSTRSYIRRAASKAMAWRSLTSDIREVRRYWSPITRREGMTRGGPRVILTRGWLPTKPEAIDERRTENRERRMKDKVAPSSHSPFIICFLPSWTALATKRGRACCLFSEIALARRTIAVRMVGRSGR